MQWLLDVIIIIGLLCAKPSGRKLAIGGAVAGIVSYAIFFQIPGIVAFSILVWYMFRTRTKEYFKIPKINFKIPKILRFDYFNFTKELS